jgi:NAD(P)-dependent dehydrogenase (short-subunit alcohol dehydrogenase family)
MSITSFGGLYRAEAPSYVHNSSKTVLNHLTKTLSLDFARSSIQANAIAPRISIKKMMQVSPKIVEKTS